MGGNNKPGKMRTVFSSSQLKTKSRGEKRGENAYRGGARLCSLDIGLEVQRGVEIAARVAAATPLHGIHAHRDCSVLGGRHGFWRVRETTLALSTLARSALEFSTDLGDTTSRLQLRPGPGEDR